MVKTTLTPQQVMDFLNNKSNGTAVRGHQVVTITFNSHTGQYDVEAVPNVRQKKVVVQQSPVVYAEDEQPNSES